MSTRLAINFFQGRACFSPSVGLAAQDAWCAHGGTFARTQQERAKADYYFCDGYHDPWLKSLRKYPIAVFCANWITDSVNARFPLILSTYVLDGAASFKVPLQPPLAVSPSHPALQVSPRAEFSTLALARPQNLKLPKTPGKRAREEDTSILQSDRRPRKKGRKGSDILKIYPIPSKMAPSSVAAPSPPLATADNLFYDSEELVESQLDPRPDGDDLLYLDEKSLQYQRLLDKSRGISTTGETVISTEDAMDSLKDVLVSRSTLFQPGRQHEGKEFWCLRAMSRPGQKDV